MDVSIILVNYKTKNLTLNSIKSIIEKTRDIDYEIIVVDNNSQDDSVEAIELEFPNVNLIRNATNSGFGSANNLAIKQAKGKYVFCLNTDTLLINNAIKFMFDFMEKEGNSNVGSCGGNLYHQDMTPATTHFNFPNIWNSSSIFWIAKKVFKFHYKPKEIKKTTQVDFITGADLFIRKSILDKIGLFDEKIFMYYEDVDLCKRIHDAGYKNILIPEAKIIHLEGKSSDNFLEKTQKSIKGKYYYLSKYHQYFSILVMKFSYIILHFFAYLFSFNVKHLELIAIHFNYDVFS